ncbi:MAG TPA: hypothetical protein VH391_06360 [Solirubrobacterales bacterium]|jgi:hypothetical protein
MHASVRKYKVDEEQIEELSRRIEDAFVPRLSGIPGFGGYYVVDATHGIVITVTLGEDAAAVERSTELATEFVRDELTDLEIERIEAAHGEVLVERTG